MQAGCPVYLYSEVCPTPFVPFGVTKFQAASGVMVTASHNPKEDNGYKVYWNNGAQVSSCKVLINFLLSLGSPTQHYKCTVCNTCLKYKVKNSSVAG